MIDNYDSFTFNLVQYLQELGEEVRVVRNDELTVAQIDALKPDRIVISPGPCTPNEAGVSVEVMKTLGPRIPVFGVCLGHQSLGQAFGGEDDQSRKADQHRKTRDKAEQEIGCDLRVFKSEKHQPRDEGQRQKSATDQGDGQHGRPHSSDWRDGGPTTRREQKGYHAPRRFREGKQGVNRIVKSG